MMTHIDINPHTNGSSNGSNSSPDNSDSSFRKRLGRKRHVTWSSENSQRLIITANVNPTTSEKQSFDEKSARVHITEQKRRWFYEAVTQYELEEARGLDIDKALEKYLSILENLKENAVDVLQMKYGMCKTSVSISELKDTYRTDAMTSLATLREQNRLLKIRLQISKDEQKESREEVDNEQVSLENLLYEAKQLQKQVEATPAIKSLPDTFDLVSVEEFYEDAPIEITKRFFTSENPQSLQLARVEHEYLLRLKLAEECRKLEKEKHFVQQKIDEMKKKLDSMEPVANNLIDAAQYLQELCE